MGENKSRNTVARQRQVTKRDGRQELFDLQKMRQAVQAAFVDAGEKEDAMASFLAEMEGWTRLIPSTESSRLQDLLESKLMEYGYFDVARCYVLYRREVAAGGKPHKLFAADIPGSVLLPVLRDIARTFPAPQYALPVLHERFVTLLDEDMTLQQRQNQLLHAALSLRTKDAPRWEDMAAQLYAAQLNEQIAQHWEKQGALAWQERLERMAADDILGKYIVESYSAQEIAELATYIEPAHDKLLPYSTLEEMVNFHLLRTPEGTLLETPQEMFMTIAMHLALPEGMHKVYWTQRIYDALGKGQLLLSTAILHHARRPSHPLCSSFTDVLPEAAEGMYHALGNMAQAARAGGDISLYLGKMRTSTAEHPDGALHWAQQLKSILPSSGDVTAHLDAWHHDLPEFLQLRTAGVLSAVCCPDYFWEMLEEDLDSTWHLMDPQQIRQIKGYALEDSMGREWQERYLDCVADTQIEKRTLPIKDIVRLLIQSMAETGGPFVFNRDTVNALNPNAHQGRIYAAAGRMEIAQNIRPMGSAQTRIEGQGEELHVLQVSRPGDMVAARPAALMLNHIDLSDDEALRYLTETAVRALDNAIDLDEYTTPYARVSKERYRALELAVDGYHPALAKQGIAWDSQAHVTWAGDIMERIHRHAISASAQLAREKPAYPCFEGSDWQSGAYFEKRKYSGETWDALRAQAARGMRNGYLMALAPAAKSSPPAHFHELDQHWTVQAAAARQKYIDQAQSVNLYITPRLTMRQVLELLISAWKQGVKTIGPAFSHALAGEEEQGGSV